MKKSIAIFSVTIILSFQDGQNMHEYASLKTELGQEVATNGIWEKPSGEIFHYLITAEEENVPWKDPWQWRDLFRRMWKFWK